nr:MAG TPA: hypothetical protein [Caudoviricetes sp.]
MELMGIEQLFIIAHSKIYCCIVVLGALIFAIFPLNLARTIKSVYF